MPGALGPSISLRPSLASASEQGVLGVETGAGSIGGGHGYFESGAGVVIEAADQAEVDGVGTPQASSAARTCAKWPRLAASRKSATLEGCRFGRDRYSDTLLRPKRFFEPPLHLSEQRSLLQRLQYGAQLTFQYDRMLIVLEQTEVSKELGSRVLDLYGFFERPL